MAGTAEEAGAKMTWPRTLWGPQAILGWGVDSSVSPGPMTVSPLTTGAVSDSSLSPQCPANRGTDRNSVKVMDKQGLDNIFRMFPVVEKRGCSSRSFDSCVMQASHVSPMKNEIQGVTGAVGGYLWARMT